MIVQKEQGGQKRKATISFEFEDEEGLKAIIEGILEKNNAALEMLKKWILKIQLPQKKNLFWPVIS